MSPDSAAPPKTVRMNGFPRKRFRRAISHKSKNPEVDRLLDLIRDDLLLVKETNGITWRQLAVKMGRSLGNRGMEVCFTTGGFRQLVLVARALGTRVRVSVE